MNIVVHAILTGLMLFGSLSFFLVPQDLWLAGVVGLVTTFWFAVFKQPE